MSVTNSVVCSFCGKDKQDTNILIAGSHAHICDLCIEQAYNIVKEDSTEKQITDSDFLLLKPKQIKSYLDEYIIGQDEAKKVILVSSILKDIK